DRTRLLCLAPPLTANQMIVHWGKRVRPKNQVFFPLVAVVLKHHFDLYTAHVCHQCRGSVKIGGATGVKRDSSAALVVSDISGASSARGPFEIKCSIVAGNSNKAEIWGALPAFTVNSRKCAT